MLLLELLDELFPVDMWVLIGHWYFLQAIGCGWDSDMEVAGIDVRVGVLHVLPTPLTTVVHDGSCALQLATVVRDLNHYDAPFSYDLLHESNRSPR